MTGGGGLLLPVAVLAALAAVPLLALPDYVMHLLITGLLTALAGTGWAMMGRFGLVSFGHGAFLGVAAYTMALLWNFAGVSPWIGVPIGVAAAAAAGALLGYPCFRLRVVGHYFALVTLAAGEIVRILVTALREWTGGSLGMTPNAAPPEGAFAAMQFDKAGFWWIALAAWAVGLLAWRLLDRSMSSKALMAIAEDEDAAASIGIHVTREKLRVTLISVALAGLAGALTAQYRMYLNPESLAGLGISLADRLRRHRRRHVQPDRPDDRRAHHHRPGGVAPHRLRHGVHRRRGLRLRHPAGAVHAVPAARHRRAAGAAAAARGAGGQRRGGGARSGGAGGAAAGLRGAARASSGAA